MPGFPNGVFPSGLLTNALYAHLLYPIRATCTAKLTFLDFINRTILHEEYKIIKLLVMQYSPFPVISSLLAQDISLKNYSQRTTPYVLLSLWHTKYHTPIKQQSPTISCSLLTLHFLTPKDKTKYSVPRGSRHSAVQPVLMQLRSVSFIPNI